MAAISVGKCKHSACGQWNWHCSHVLDGKVFIADWEFKWIHRWKIVFEIAPDGFVYLAFTSKK